MVNHEIYVTLTAHAIEISLREITISQDITLVPNFFTMLSEKVCGMKSRTVKINEVTSWTHLCSRCEIMLLCHPDYNRKILWSDSPIKIVLSKDKQFFVLEII